MNKKLFVPYEIALMLKEKRFEEPCIGLYQKDFRGDQEIRYFKSNMGHYDLFSNFTTGKWTRWFPSEGSGRPDYWKLDDVALMPLYQQVIDWFRTKHKIKIIESEYFSDTKDFWFVKNNRDLREYDSLELAIEGALKLI